MIIKGIDNDKEFDWGNTSKDYAKYRDIYPQEFYDYILSLGACKDDQKVLDVGTGTGVLPRNMYKYGSNWTAHSDYVHPVWVPAKWDKEHFAMLEANAPEEFNIKHYVSIAELKVKK